MSGKREKIYSIEKIKITGISHCLKIAKTSVYVPSDCSYMFL